MIKLTDILNDILTEGPYEDQMKKLRADCCKRNPKSKCCDSSMVTDPTGGLLQAMGGRNPNNVNLTNFAKQLGYQGIPNPRATTRQRRNINRGNYRG